ncbi:MAG TPA: hypothetical protein VGM90_37390 [Kofleriaceae bacterium]
MKAFLTLLIALPACGSEARTGTPDANGVSLIWVGGGPRQVLRYVPHKGDTTPLRLVTESELTSVGNQGKEGGALPTLTIDGTLAIDDVLADGSARLRLLIGEITASSTDATTMPADAMERNMQLMHGASVVATLQPDGVIKDVQTSSPAKLPPGLQAQLEAVGRSFSQVAMPLPHTPVGAGAIWRVLKPMTENNMKLVVVTTVSVGALEGDRASYTMASSLGGENQSVDMGGGTVIAMHGIGGAGTGSGTLDLAHAIATGETRLEFHAGMSSSGEDETTTMRTTTRVTTASK